MDLSTLPPTFDIDALFKGMDPLLLNNNTSLLSSPEDVDGSSPEDSSPDAQSLGSKRKTNTDSADSAANTIKDRRSLSGQLSHHHADLSFDDQSKSGNAKARAARSALAANVGSTTDRRKEQNRNAQRAFRERKEKHIKELQDRVDELLEQNSSKDSENELLRQLISNLQQENQSLRVNGSTTDSSSVPATTTNIASDFPFSFSMPNTNSSNSSESSNNNITSSPQSMIPPLAPQSTNSLSSASSTAPSSIVFSPSNFLNDLDSPGSALSSNTKGSPYSTVSNGKQNSLNSISSPSNNTESKSSSTTSPADTSSSAFPSWSGTAFTDYRNDSNFSIFGDIPSLFNTDYDNSFVINNSDKNSPSSLPESAKDSPSNTNYITDPNVAFDELASRAIANQAAQNLSNGSKSDCPHSSTLSPGEQYSFDLDGLCKDMKTKAVCKEAAQQLLKQSLEEDEKRLAEAFPLNS